MEVETLRGYATMLGFLHLALRREPGMSALQMHHSADLFSSAPCAIEQGATQEGLQKLSQWAKGDIEADSIGLEYRMLFEGPEMPVCPPWESAFLSKDNLLMQEETIDVRSFYGRCGLAMNSPLNEPEDHIALELVFCSVLTEQAADALEAQDDVTYWNTMETLRDFAQKHLFKWGIEWAKGLSDNASTLYYQGVGLLLEGSLQGLMKDLLDTKPPCFFE